MIGDNGRFRSHATVNVRSRVQHHPLTEVGILDFDKLRESKEQRQHLSDVQIAASRANLEIIQPFLSQLLDYEC
jgi:hypothetical protein